MRFKPRYAAIAIIILVVEVLIATTFAANQVIRGSIGDFLIVILLYYLILAFVRVPPVSLALGIFLLACATEVSQYFHLADALGLERGSILSIILGTTFSWNDVLMYFLGCMAALLLNLGSFKERAGSR